MEDKNTRKEEYKKKRVQEIKNPGKGKSKGAFFFIPDSYRDSFLYIFISLHLFLFSSSAFFAQDFHLSQYDEAAINLNPALTGQFSGTYRLHSHYRSQWAPISRHPYQTVVLSGEKKLKKFSAGAQIANQRAGEGNYNAFGLLLSAAYEKPLDKKKFHRLSAGLQAGFAFKSVNLSKLSFDAQYTTYNGGGFDQTLYNQEPNIGQTAFLPDLNFGLLYNFSKLKTRVNPFLGGTVFHLTMPKESFFSENNRLPMRFQVHGGMKVNVTEQFQAVPKAMYMTQAQAKELLVGIDLNYFIKNSTTFVTAGVAYRQLDANVYYLGVKHGRYTYKVSYDINNSSLKHATNGRGGFEISVTMIGTNFKPVAVPQCPKLI